MWTKWDLVGMGRDNACGSNEALSNETIMESKKMIIFFLTPIILVPFPHPKRFLS